MLRRSARSLGSSLFLVGCTVDGGGEDTNPFGDDTAVTSVGTAMGETAGPTSGDPNTSGDTGSATGVPTTGTPATGDTSTGTPPAASEGSTAAEGTTVGPGQGQLGECIGTGAWESCAQYCGANLEVCVEAGCDGMTVVYYGDVGSCSAMEADDGAATPCAEGFTMGGGISFARCCCT